MFSLRAACCVGACILDYLSHLQQFVAQLDAAPNEQRNAKDSVRIIALLGTLNFSESEPENIDSTLPGSGNIDSF